MLETRATGRAYRDIVRLAHTRSDSLRLRQTVAERLRQYVPFDAYCWWTTDPGTMFLTTSAADWMPSFCCLDLHVNEYVEPDFNKFRDLARGRAGAGALERSTEGHPERSRRYRKLMHPDGLEAELRASQVADSVCWGALALYRREDRPDFDDREIDFIARLGPHLAEGLRTSLLADAAADETGPDAPGLVLLDADGRVTAITAGASQWLGRLGDGLGGRMPEHRLSDAIYAVASVVRNLDDQSVSLPRARVRVDSGDWLLVHGALLAREEGPTGEVAVMVERARPAQIVSLLISVYGLTEREADVVKGVLLGHSTQEIAKSTYLSPYTVQDYLKSIFDKVGVRSRRELVAKIFVEQHWPLYGDGNAKLDARGWFAAPTAR